MGLRTRGVSSSSSESDESAQNNLLPTQRALRGSSRQVEENNVQIAHVQAGGDSFSLSSPKLRLRGWRLEKQGSELMGDDNNESGTTPQVFLGHTPSNSVDNSQTGGPSGSSPSLKGRKWGGRFQEALLPTLEGGRWDAMMETLNRNPQYVFMLLMFLFWTTKIFILRRRPKGAAKRSLKFGQSGPGDSRLGKESAVQVVLLTVGYDVDRMRVEVEKLAGSFHFTADPTGLHSINITATLRFTPFIQGIVQSLGGVVSSVKIMRLASRLRLSPQRMSPAGHGVLRLLLPIATLDSDSIALSMEGHTWALGEGSLWFVNAYKPYGFTNICGAAQWWLEVDLTNSPMIEAGVQAAAVSNTTDSAGGASVAPSRLITCPSEFRVLKPSSLSRTFGEPLCPDTQKLIEPVRVKRASSPRPIPCGAGGGSPSRPFPAGGGGQSPRPGGVSVRSPDARSRSNSMVYIQSPLPADGN